MATLNLLPRKEFEITYEVDGQPLTISGKFGTAATQRFCTQRGFKTLNEMREAFLNNLSMADITEFLLASVYVKARKNNLPFSYTEIDAGEWIDELGGMESEGFAKLFNHAADENQKKMELKEVA